MESKSLFLMTMAIRSSTQKISSSFPRIGQILDPKSSLYLYDYEYDFYHFIFTFSLKFLKNRHNI